MGRLALAGLIGATGTGLLIAMYALSLSPRVYFDFENFYAAGLILRNHPGSQLYDMALQREVEHNINPRAPFLPFEHTPPEALAFLLLTPFPFRSALLIWSAFNLALLGPSLYGLRHTGYRIDPDGRIPWILVSIPLVAAPLTLGQDGLLLLAVFLLAYLCLVHRQEVAAGIALGLGLFRFEILLPFLFIFLLRGRRKVLAGSMAVCGLGLLLSFAIVGWHGLQAYAHLLLHAANPWGGGAGGSVWMMPSLRGGLAAVLPRATPNWLLLLLTGLGSFGLLGWAAWRFRNVCSPERPSFGLEFSLCVEAALLAGYYLPNTTLSPLILVSYIAMSHEGEAHLPVRNRAGSLLLLLFAIMIVFWPDFACVLSIVLLGHYVWLSEEIRLGCASPRLV